MIKQNAKVIVLALEFLLMFQNVVWGYETHSDILENYDPKVPPLTKDGPIKITIGLVLTHFHLDETDQQFQANVWFTLRWKDTRLSWNRTEDNSTTNMRFSSHEIWGPDITLINNAYPTEMSHYGESLLFVQPDGEVSWTPPSKLVSHCAMNMIRWPHDEHNCFFKIGSWTHSGKEIDLEIDGRVMSDPNHAIDSMLYVPNSEWSLISTKAEKEDEFYACCDNPYAVVKYSFQIKRSSPAYTATVILPIFVITVVNIMVFILPPTANEKIIISSTNFFIVCIFLIYFEIRLPALGDHLPLLVLLYACNVVLIGISIIVSVIVIKISRTRRASSPPQCFRMFCNANFAQFLGLGYMTPYVSQTHSRLDDEVEMRPPGQNGRMSLDLGRNKDDHDLLVMDQEYPCHLNAEWILLAAMIDRLTLIIYTIVSGITLGLCMA